MATTLLVTTDFSANSKAGIRFAIQLAAQSKQSIVFYHCRPYLRPTRWTDAQYESYNRKETEKAANALGKFVLDIYKAANIRKPKFECFVDQGPDVSKAIIDHALKIGASAICMSTRGAGRLKKIMGTHASGIIHGSPVPVFVIPKSYRRTPVKQVLYASDLNNLGAELKQVRELARALKSKTSVFHYDYLADVDEARMKLEAVAKQHKAPGVKFHFQKYNVDRSLASHLLKDIRASRASLVVLFTNQKRGWFDRMFLASKSVDVAYDSKVPLLIIPKG